MQRLVAIIAIGLLLSACTNGGSTSAATSLSPAASPSPSPALQSPTPATAATTSVVFTGNVKASGATAIDGNFTTTFKVAARDCEDLATRGATRSSDGLKYWPLPPGKATISGHTVSGGGLLSYPGGPGSWVVDGSLSGQLPTLNASALVIDSNAFGLVSGTKATIEVHADGSGTYTFTGLQDKTGAEEDGVSTWTCAEA